MLPSWANDEVTRIRPGTKESRGSTIPDWSQPNVLKISGCSVQPAQTTLSQDGRVLGLTEGYTVFFPPGSDVKGGDKLTWNGQDFQIIGEPRQWNSPTGRVSSLQAAIERWAG